MSRHHLIKAIFKDRILFHKTFEVSNSITIREFRLIINKELMCKYLNENIKEDWDNNLMNFSLINDRELMNVYVFAEDHQLIEEFCINETPLKYCKRCRYLDFHNFPHTRQYDLNNFSINDLKSRKKLMKYINNRKVAKSKKILERGLDPNFIDSETGESPLSIITSLISDFLRQKSKKETMKKVINNEINMDYNTMNQYSSKVGYGNLNDSKLSTHLQHALNIIPYDNNNNKIDTLFEIFKIIIHNGAHASFKTSDGSTVFHRAAILNNLIILRYLIKLNYYPYVLDNKGLTAFYVAISSGCSVSIAGFFFSHEEYQLDEKDYDSGNTIFHHMSKRGFFNLLEFILCHAFELCKKELKRYLWLKNLIESINNNGNTALKLAVVNSNLDCAKLLERISVSLKYMTESCSETYRSTTNSTDSSSIVMGKLINLNSLKSDDCSYKESLRKNFTIFSSKIYGSNQGEVIPNINKSFIGAINVVSVIKAHLGANEGELTICIGDKLQLLNQFHSGCSYGILCYSSNNLFNENNKEGWIPTSCISRKPKKINTYKNDDFNFIKIYKFKRSLSNLRSNSYSKQCEEEFCIPRELRRKCIVGAPFRITISLSECELGFEIKTLPFSLHKREDSNSKKTVQSLHEVGRVIIDSQAYKSGLTTGCLILGVEDVDITLCEHSYLVNLIKKNLNSHKRNISFTCCSVVLNTLRNILVSTSNDAFKSLTDSSKYIGMYPKINCVKTRLYNLDSNKTFSLDNSTKPISSSIKNSNDTEQIRHHYENNLVNWSRKTLRRNSLKTHGKTNDSTFSEAFYKNKQDNSLKQKNDGTTKNCYNSNENHKMDIHKVQNIESFPQPPINFFIG